MDSIKGLFGNEAEEKAASHAYLCQIPLLVIQINAATTDKVQINCLLLHPCRHKTTFFVKVAKLHDDILVVKGKICCAL